MPHHSDARHGPDGLLQRLGTKRMVFVNAAVLAIVLYGLGGEYLRSRVMSKEITKLESEAAALTAKNAESLAANQAGSTQAELEREARLKLNLRKPGEEVVIVRGDPAATERVLVADDARGTASNAVKWWRYFFK